MNAALGLLALLALLAPLAAADPPHIPTPPAPLPHFGAGAPILTQCTVIGLGLTPTFPYVAQIDWDCVWSILQTHPLP